MTASVTTLRIVAAVVVGADGRHLLVRKRGTTSFMQVGGKIEPGEDPMAALLREFEEEVGLVLDPARPVPLGKFGAPAANEPDHRVDAHAFVVRLAPGERPRAQAELEELRWIDPVAPMTPHPIAPLSFDLLAAWLDREAGGASSGTAREGTATT
ncbi:NUDIX hydrolase [Myceligenerans pegani]|uniref:NUDIX domain-containing protein n=1 Tax=Myceligenerans pegani TaxID=2776917 RepID=A0ABR9MUL9_9MICO|nr:NUDIX domain-containing protein [Myceligenerans sp. TRM 65318]MBE1875074.1 NUDIX domain-containing protein [Myceligenerans sp. TRM 65318]MBE3017345.1 NUDIX domain-containing protein [Myceligenerans sp. TRM 65318]